jgi:hypothetical protein
MTQPERPRRVVVSRQVPPPRSAAGVDGGRDIDEQTSLGESYMRSLVRTQLRLALAMLALVNIPLVLLPLVFFLDVGIGELTIGSVPLPWLLLGVAVYPLLVLVGWRYVRQAERNEAEFVRIVARR